ncbi:putative bifunctional diguanylate cyclase/phosphodiesterase [Methylobacterium bullatum]|uniref:Putative signaling protein n=1 Tax=Methylobacterium bullatum TaxID=570505 RepID=A0A679JHV4_9HYPH|nr:putative signaling protein [Methylobacterium bullatum]
MSPHADPRRKNVSDDWPANMTATRRTGHAEGGPDPTSPGIEQIRGGGETELLAVNADLREQVRLFEAALQNMNQGLCMFDTESRLVVTNRRYHEIFDIPADAIARGMTQHDICAMLIAQGCYPPSETLEWIEEATRAALQSDNGLPILRELADGRVLSVLYRVIQGGGWVSTFEDITEQQRSAARIAHLAHHDVLTDLANTRAMRLKYLDLIEATDPERPLLAMCYIDLDRFKFVNDTYGYATGDELLQAVAVRLRRNTRREDIVARLGGDEFAVIHRITDETDAPAMAQRLVDALSRPYEISGSLIEIGASVGVTTRPLHDVDIDPLLHDADLALRHAKAEGRGTFSVFDVGMSEAARARRLIETELQVALAEEQFELHYQTLVDADGGRIIGVEALVRWRHPERGLIPPLSFIPIMEETGLLLPLGNWILERACRDAMLWPDHITVAVNVSSEQMRQRSFGDTVLAVLAKTGLPARRLEIEITESSLLEESEVPQANLAVIHDAGISIAMDDFGTGYSSLSYLRRFPINKIKIDRSFMKDAETSADARAIIRAVSALGASMGLTTLIEGVETVQQLEFARLEGVGQLQGYLFSRPQPESVVTKLLYDDRLQAASEQ